MYTWERMGTHGKDHDCLVWFQGITLVFACACLLQSHDVSSTLAVIYTELVRGGTQISETDVAMSMACP